MRPPAAPAKASRRVARGRTAQARGVEAERLAEAALVQDGWTILARRLRTRAGELDLVAERDGLLAFVEVKARRTLADAAWSLGPAQQRRLLRAGEAALARNPGWGRAGVRFDVLLVDATEQVRRIVDALRL